MSPEQSAAEGDATRRTRLAAERTQLAWWRTGLTALAVGIGIGGVIPQLDPDLDRLPYALLGGGFGLYAALLYWFGSVRGRDVVDAVDRGGYAAPGTAVNTAFTIVGVVLALATGALVLFS